MIQLAALLTVHNRKEKTLLALKCLANQQGLSSLSEVKVYLVDDGSADGTASAVAESFPETILLKGNGSLYWNGGMRLAFGEALKAANYDYYLWLNDDTTLFADTLAKMISTSVQLNNKAIVIASIQDPDTGELTYGGLKRVNRWRPLKFTHIAPDTTPVSVETMNGNCVLIPHDVANTIGNLDSAFTHGIGDFDYGLRARKFGFEVYLAPGFCGYCKRNPAEDSKLSINKRWKKLVSPLGLPPKEWAIFSKRYAGPFWLIYWILPYLRKL